MISMVTHTPKRHFRCAEPLLSEFMLKIQVFKMLSHMINRMHREVVIGERARVSTKFRFEYTQKTGSMYTNASKLTTIHFIQGTLLQGTYYQMQCVLSNKDGLRIKSHYSGISFFIGSGAKSRPCSSRYSRLFIPFSLFFYYLKDLIIINYFTQNY